MPSAQYVVGEEAWFWGRFESIEDAVEDKMEALAVPSSVSKETHNDGNVDKNVKKTPLPTDEGE